MAFLLYARASRLAVAAALFTKQAVLAQRSLCAQLTLALGREQVQQFNAFFDGCAFAPTVRL